MLRHKILAATTSLLILATSVAAADAQGTLNTACSEGVVEIQANYINDGSQPDWVGLVVTRDRVGLCDEPVVILPEMWPLPELFVPTDYGFSEIPPAMDQYFRYILQAVDSAGELHLVEPQGDLLCHDFAACGPAVAARGFLWDTGDWSGIEPCPATCWFEVCVGPLDIDGLDPEVWETYVNTGIPVNLYGEAFVSGMPVSPCLIVSDVQPTEGGECGPAPTAPTSWSSLKHRYR
jgi:hypothetical protein